MALPRPAASSPAPTPGPSRMRLDAVTRGRRSFPPKTLAYGPEGIGKSTFGACAPSPIFLDVEEGTNELDVARFPQPEVWPEVLEAVHHLETETHSYQNLVIDSLDRLESLIHAFICKRDNQDNIESYGYGRGHAVALDEWRLLLAALDRLRRIKNMGVVFIAHSCIRTFKNPGGEDFDRYEMKINPKAAGLIKEWADVVLFLNHEIVTKKDQRTKRVRGVTTGARFIYTEHSSHYDAKNRFNLPPVLSLDWEEYAAALAKGAPAALPVLIDEIKRKAATVGGEVETMTLAFLTAKATDAAALARLNSRLNAKLAELEEAKGE